MRVLIYARLSSFADNSTSIERQLKMCRELAEQCGWFVAGEYVDDGVSGAVAPEDRPSMSKLLQQFADVDAVVTWKVDRLSRSLLDFSRLLKVAERDGVDIVSCTEQLDTTTAMGRAFAQLVALFAEMERSMNCVEVQEHATGVDARDTTRRDHETLSFPACEWTAFVSDLRDSRLR